MAVFIFAWMYSIGGDPHVLWFIGVLILSTTLPILFNAKGKYELASLYFMVSAYILIFCLALGFGPELHYQYFFIGGVGIPLLFLGHESNLKKISFSGFSIVCWVVYELFFTQWPTFFTIPSNYIKTLAWSNDFLVFITVFFTGFFFVRESEKHIKDLDAAKTEVLINNKELKNLTYVMSHDLKQPLQNVLNMVAMLKESKENLTPFQLQIVNRLEIAGLKGKELVFNVLELASFKVPEQDMENIDLATVFQGIVFENEYRKDVEFDFNPENFPVFRGVPFHWAQVASNLIGNAIKYGNKAHTRIQIDSEKQADGWKVAIKDNGIGLDPKKLDSLWLPFHRATTQKSSESSGLGLAIVKEIVENHKGKVGAFPNPETGSTFWFHIPFPEHQVTV